MALRRVPYRSVQSLIRRQLSTDEDESAAELIRDLQKARVRGHLTKQELERICYWKSPRAIHRVRSNSGGAVRSATRAALGTRSEQRRLTALLSLNGVSVPMASAILTLLFPKRYGVIDIRVWQLLYELGTVTKKPQGVGFNFKNWYQFLMIIRYFAKQHGVSVRAIERTLFMAHRRYQKGTLYD